MAKAHATLKAAIMNGMTQEQQKQLAELITEMAQSAKQYGQALSDNELPLNTYLKLANDAWQEIYLQTGLDTRF